MNKLKTAKTISRANAKYFIATTVYVEQKIKAKDSRIFFD